MKRGKTTERRLVSKPHIGLFRISRGEEKAEGKACALACALENKRLRMFINDAASHYDARGRSSFSTYCQRGALISPAVLRVLVIRIPRAGLAWHSLINGATYLSISGRRARQRRQHLYNATNFSAGSCAANIMPYSRKYTGSAAERQRRTGERRAAGDAAAKRLNTGAAQRAA